VTAYLEARKITKTFGRFRANDEVNISIRKGEIHGVVGENGAGKSTLMKILYGMHRADSGELFILGNPVELKDPSHALKLGIGMVHQHFMLIQSMQVIENLILGAEPQRGWWIDEEFALKEFEKLSKEIQSSLRVNAEVRNLTIGEQQSLEILKLLFRKSECLIFDEPTGVLTPQEVDRFLEILRRLKGFGKTIVLITHKLKEILSVADRITVMRAGKSVGEVEARNVTTSELARLMVGREVHVMQSRLARKLRSRSGSLLECRNLSTDQLKNLSFEIQPGEILGVAGIEGNGQRDLAQVLWGLERLRSGQIRFEGQPVDGKSLRERKKLGISHIPEDRHSDALILDMNLLENLFLGAELHYKKNFVFPTSELHRDLAKDIERFDIKTQNLKSLARSLSGGNQQKLILARELRGMPKFLIAAQPTRGVDVGAIERIHAELIRQRDRGLAILLISSELDELLSLSDRIIVMREFQISACFENLDLDWTELRYQIGEAMICRS
jgi:ABC-type uncharacterized transport system ATPase subunit